MRELLRVILIGLCFWAPSHAKPEPKAEILQATKRVFELVLEPSREKAEKGYFIAHTSRHFRIRKGYFSEEFFEALVFADQTWIDFRKQLRDDFVDCDPLTFTQEEAITFPKLKVTKVDKSIAEVQVNFTIMFRGFHQDQLVVDLVKERNEWCVDNVRRPNCNHDEGNMKKRINGFRRIEKWSGPDFPETKFGFKLPLAPSGFEICVHIPGVLGNPALNGVVSCCSRFQGR